VQVNLQFVDDDEVGVLGPGQMGQQLASDLEAKPRLEQFAIDPALGAEHDEAPVLGMLLRHGNRHAGPDRLDHLAEVGETFAVAVPVIAEVPRRTWRASGTLNCFINDEQLFLFKRAEHRHSVDLQ